MATQRYVKDVIDCYQQHIHELLKMNRLTELTEKFKDKTVFIIGGGNSLSGFDFSRLENKCVIALNSAYKFVGKDAVFFLDGPELGI